MDFSENTLSLSYKLFKRDLEPQNNILQLILQNLWAAIKTIWQNYRKRYSIFSSKKEMI